MVFEIFGDDYGKWLEDYKECLNNNCWCFGMFVCKYRLNCWGVCFNFNLNFLYVFENYWEKESNDGMVFWIDYFFMFMCVFCIFLICIYSLGGKKGGKVLFRFYGFLGYLIFVVLRLWKGINRSLRFFKRNYGFGRYLKDDLGLLFFVFGEIGWFLDEEDGYWDKM